MTSLPNESPNPDQLDSSHNLRDEARARWQALAREARRRWNEIEAKLDGVDARLTQEGEPLDALLPGALTRARELSRMISDWAHEAATQTDELAHPVRSLITQPAHCCSPTAPLSHAAKLLWENDCGALVVTDSDGHPLGVITDRDICMAAYTRGLPLHAMTVASCMSQALYAIEADATIHELCALFARHQVRRAPVLHQGRVVGMLSVTDLVRLAVRSAAGMIPLSVLLTRVWASITEPRRLQAATADEVLPSTPRSSGIFEQQPHAPNASPNRVASA